MLYDNNFFFIVCNKLSLLKFELCFMHHLDLCNSVTFDERPKSNDSTKTFSSISSREVHSHLMENCAKTAVSNKLFIEFLYLNNV